MARLDIKKEDAMNETKRLWIFLGAVIFSALFVLGWFGHELYRKVPPNWRWWVVHLWVEGFFEVFAAAVIAFIFTRLGLVRFLSAARALLFSAAIYLYSGIPGTFHHLYFAGTPISIMAVGATLN